MKTNGKSQREIKKLDRAMFTRAVEVKGLFNTAREREIKIKPVRVS